MIFINKNNNIISLKTDVDGKIEWHDVEMPKHNPVDFIYLWLLCKCRRIFATMPHGDIKIFGCNDLGEPLTIAANIIQCTNDAIKKYRHLKDSAILNDTVLFWNVSDDMRYKSLYGRLNQKEEIKYLNLQLGFDRKTRTWNPTPLPMTVDELVKLIEINKIKKLTTINTYLIDKYLYETGINLITLLEFMGVEVVLIDNDPFDLTPSGFYRREFLNPKFRFSNLSCLNEGFDKKQGVNAHYIAIPQNYSAEEPKPLKDDYDIIVLSNSRWQNVQSMLPAIEAIMNSIPNNYQNINLWYLALRHMVLNVFVMPELERHYQNSLLHQFYFMCVQWLKFKIINDIKTGRTVKVFGDDGWMNVCPQYYQGSLDNSNINRLYSEGNHLYLLLNASFSYLDASGPVYDVIRRRVPWINIPPMAKASELSEMRHVEYTNPERLNELINNYKTVPAYEKALEYYESVLNSSVIDIENHILENSKGESEFSRQRVKHKKLIDSMIFNHINENEPFLRNCYRGLFCGQAT